MTAALDRAGLSRAARALIVVAVLLGLQLGPARPAGAEPGGLASEMIERVNQVRAEAGLPPLAEDGNLDALAIERSADMAARHYFSHTTPDGLTVFDLLQERGLSYRLAGENLAWNTYDPSRSGAVALQGFLNSPPHRANLLNPEYTVIGVGVAIDGGRTLFTLVFVG